jgi:hypothetical protein
MVLNFAGDKNKCGGGRGWVGGGLDRYQMCKYHFRICLFFTEMCSVKVYLSVLMGQKRFIS